ncbi:MAG: UbiX family flavin prenyltransferase, partial [Gammaproteobacteria bacterium]
QLYGARDGQLRVFGDEEWTSPVASGSGAPLRMVVCPASMATVSAIATGASENLLERAADVVIKERGNLVIVPRETPFSAIHLENMLKLARLDVTILPANPGFYNRPARVEELVDFIVARVLDQFDIEHDLMKRWG